MKSRVLALYLLMHEECLKDTEGAVESGYLCRVLKIGWRVRMSLYLNNSEEHIQFFILRLYHFYKKMFFNRHSMFGNLR